MFSFFLILCIYICIKIFFNFFQTYLLKISINSWTSGKLCGRVKAEVFAFPRPVQWSSWKSPHNKQLDIRWQNNLSIFWGFLLNFWKYLEKKKKKILSFYFFLIKKKKMVLQLPTCVLPKQSHVLLTFGGK